MIDIDITRIERTPNENEISFKWCDYSVQTIDNLINQGIKDTLNLIIGESLQRHNQKKGKAEDEIKAEIKAEIEAFKSSVEDEKQIEQLDERYAILLTDEADAITYYLKYKGFKDIIYGSRTKTLKKLVK